MLMERFIFLKAFNSKGYRSVASWLKYSAIGSDFFNKKTETQSLCNWETLGRLCVLL